MLARAPIVRFVALVVAVEAAALYWLAPERWAIALTAAAFLPLAGLLLFVIGQRRRKKRLSGRKLASVRAAMVAGGALLASALGFSLAELAGYADASSTARSVTSVLLMLIIVFGDLLAARLEAGSSEAEPESKTKTEIGTGAALTPAAALAALERVDARPGGPGRPSRELFAFEFEGASWPVATEFWPARTQRPVGDRLMTRFDRSVINDLRAVPTGLTWPAKQAVPCLPEGAALDRLKSALMDALAAAPLPGSLETSDRPLVSFVHFGAETRSVTWTGRG